MAFQIALKGQGKEFSLTEQNFFKDITDEIQRREKQIPWKQRRQFKGELHKKGHEYVLKLIDVKANAEIERIVLHKNQSLQELEIRLLTELNTAIEQHTIQAALDIQRDYKDAQALARKIDSHDDDFNEGFLTDLRNVALGNLKDIAKMKEKGL